MLILAIEQSSDLGSVALLNDEEILGAREWNGLIERSGGLILNLRKLLAGFPARMDEIDAYAIDVGPGSYSGLRSSMAAGRAFTLPHRKPIYAVTSAEALAFEIMNEYLLKNMKKVGLDCDSTELAEVQSGRLNGKDAAGSAAADCPALPKECPDLSFDKIQVVGDARRGQWWTCAYQSGGDIPAIQAKLGLVNENELKAEPGAVIVSPDWHRIGDKLRNINYENSKIIRNARRAERDVHLQSISGGPGAPRTAFSQLSGNYLIEERAVPKAGWLGRLAFRKMRLKIESEPLTPVYLHAAVVARLNTEH